EAVLIAEREKAIEYVRNAVADIREKND
ncbi:hypothetical protein EVA_09607, partial [gut metagenome]